MTPKSYGRDPVILEVPYLDKVARQTHALRYNRITREIATCVIDHYWNFSPSVGKIGQYLQTSGRQFSITTSTPVTVWIAGDWGVEPPNCFLNPLNTLSNYVLGVRLSYILYRPTYNLHFNLQFKIWSDSDRRKVQPPANFSQFKHWRQSLLVGL